MAQLEDFLSSGDGVLDLGANVGEYARKYAEKVGPSGCVLAVEPDPESAETCRAALANYPQATVLNAGIDAWHHAGTLYRDKDRKRNSLWQDNVLEDAGDPIEVSLITLDDVARRVPNLRGIKVDLQGAEMRMLQGGTTTLQNPRLVWAVELWPTGLQHAGSSYKDVARTFERYGWVPADGRWQQYHDAAPKQHGHGAMDVVLVHRSTRENYSPDSEP